MTPIQAIQHMPSEIVMTKEENFDVELRVDAMKTVCVNGSLWL
jgi:hypothetical protein